MKIYLIRHGETTGDVEDRYGGDYDDDLSHKGVREAEKLAKELKDKGIQELYTSPRLRALHTARILAKALHVKPQIIEDLRERNNYGILTGMIKAEAKSKYPGEVKELEKGYKHKVSGSESYEHFKTRILHAFNTIISRDSHSAIAIVTHGGPIMCIVRELLKAGEFKELGDCAVIELSKSGKRILIDHMERASLIASPKT